MIIGSGGDTPWTFKRVWEDLQARWQHGTMLEKSILIGFAVAVVMVVAGTAAYKLQQDQSMPPRDKQAAQAAEENGSKAADGTTSDPKTAEEKKAEEQAKQQAQAGNGSNKTGGSGGSSGSSGGGSSGGGSGGGSSGNTNNGDCPAYPSFPDENCTGPNGSLSLYTGSTSFYMAGQVIENVEIRTDDIYVGADNITFRNVKVVYTGALDGGFTIFNIPPGVTGTTFEDCEIDGQNKIARAIKGPSDVTVRNCEIHHTANAVEVGTSFAVYDSYFHDIFTPDGQDWHADGIQSAESVSNITIKHNTILLTGGETGAINIIGNPGDSISNVLIENNLMAGGGYTVYAGAPSTSNYRVINNHFSTRYHSKVGVYNIWYPNLLSSVTRSGNVIHETGASANNNL